MRKALCIIAMSFTSMSGSSFADEIADFESQQFRAQYFAKLGTVLLPVPRPIEVGSVVYSRDFSVERTLSECLVDPTKAIEIVERTEVPSTWDSSSNTLTGNVTVKSGWSDVELIFERQDSLASAEEGALHVLSDTLTVSNFGIRTYIKDDCQAWFEKGTVEEYPENEAPDFFVVSNLHTWKGTAKHTAELTIGGDASVSFKVSDILQSVERFPWAYEILSRLDFEAEIGAGRTTTTGKDVRHNVSEEATSLTFLAFRPMYYDKFNKEKFLELVNEIRVEFYAATASREQSASFLEDRPDLSMLNGIMYSAIFPGPGEQRVYSENIQTVEAGITNGDLEPQFFADVSQLVAINVMAGHLKSLQ